MQLNISIISNRTLFAARVLARSSSAFNIQVSISEFLCTLSLTSIRNANFALNIYDKKKQNFHTQNYLEQHWRGGHKYHVKWKVRSISLNFQTIDKPFTEILTNVFFYGQSTKTTVQMKGNRFYRMFAIESNVRLSGQWLHLLFSFSLWWTFDLEHESDNYLLINAAIFGNFIQKKNYVDEHKQKQYFRNIPLKSHKLKLTKTPTNQANGRQNILASSSLFIT